MKNRTELLFNKVAQWTETEKIYRAIFFSTFLLVLGYWVLISKDIASYRFLKAQETRLYNELTRIQQENSHLPRYRDEIQTLNDRFVILHRYFSIQATAIPELLDNLAQQGVNCGLIFEALVPMQARSRDFYLELPIKIVVLGKYHQFMAFLYRITNMHQMITWHDFVIERVAGNGQSQDMLDLLSMKMTAKIYRSFT
jgi:type IV pilus assembly protein PilO